MSIDNYYTEESENVIDFEECSDAPSVRKIMASKNSTQLNERFSGNYNPKRRKMLTEIDKENGNSADFKESSQNTKIDKGKKQPENQVNKEGSKFNIVNNQNKVKDNRRITQKVEVEVREEFYEEGSHFSYADHSEGGYIEEDTVDFRPSTNKNKSEEFKHFKQEDSREETKQNKPANRDTPMQLNDRDMNFISTENNFTFQNHEKDNEEVLQTSKNKNEEITKIINRIDLEYIDESIKQRRWINRSVMERRDNFRLEDKRRKEAQLSLKRVCKEYENVKMSNSIHTNKKSK